MNEARHITKLITYPAVSVPYNHVKGDSHSLAASTDALQFTESRNSHIRLQLRTLKTWTRFELRLLALALPFVQTEAMLGAS